MSYVVNRSGRKLGTARDARIAHAVAVAGRYAADRAEREYWRADDEWYEGGQNGLRPELDLQSAYAPYLPTGWRVLGRGAYRVTFLSPKGVVYKVNRSFTDGYEGNSEEMLSIYSVRGSVPYGWAVPDATLYRVPMPHSADDTVIAMPVVDTSAPLNGCWGKGYGKCKCNNSAGNKRLRSDSICTHEVFRSGSDVFSDLHEGNVFPDADGILWVLDVSAY